MPVVEIGALRSQSLPKACFDAQGNPAQRKPVPVEKVDGVETEAKEIEPILARDRRKQGLEVEVRIDFNQGGWSLRKVNRGREILPG